MKNKKQNNCLPGIDGKQTFFGCRGVCSFDCSVRGSIGRSIGCSSLRNDDDNEF